MKQFFLFIFIISLSAPVLSMDSADESLESWQEDELFLHFTDGWTYSNEKGFQKLLCKKLLEVKNRHALDESVAPDRLSLTFKNTAHTEKNPCTYCIVFMFALGIGVIVPILHRVIITNTY